MVPDFNSLKTLHTGSFNSPASFISPLNSVSQATINSKSLHIIKAAFINYKIDSIQNRKHKNDESRRNRHN